MSAGVSSVRAYVCLCVRWVGLVLDACRGCSLRPTVCTMSCVFVWHRLSHVGEETNGQSGRNPTFIPGLEEETIRKVAVTPQNLAVLLEVRGPRVVCGSRKMVGGGGRVR